jgi:hypothetical protein
MLSTLRSRVQHDIDLSSTILTNVVAQVIAVVVSATVVSFSTRTSSTSSPRGGTSYGRTFRKRTRRSVQDIYEEMGDLYFCRAYRMKYETFLELASELGPYIERAIRCRAGSRAPNYIPNGRILPDFRLACAIRWFTGGFVYDIMTTYGVSRTDTMRSC